MNYVTSLKSASEIKTECLIIGVFNKNNLGIAAKNINDVLNFTVLEALEFFENIPVISRKLEIINEGNIYVGKKGGTATTEDGTVIKAKNFKYDNSFMLPHTFGFG